MAGLTLINTNRMKPPIAPIGLDYIAGAVQRSGFDVELLDLNLVSDPDAALEQHFRRRQPDLVGLTLRNVDDCFWPSARSFLSDFCRVVASVREHTDAAVVVGGVGYSIFPKQILELAGADFGIHGDGEQALVQLLTELRGSRQWDRVPGLVFSEDGVLRSNPPAWPHELSIPVERDWIDNVTYYKYGGQIGVETKRGCPRKCTYCADPLAKGQASRLRNPAEVADEMESLLARGIEVLHLCDPEFNLPLRHAEDVCDELIRRNLGRRLRWYAYLAVDPFSSDLARRMRLAGCVGINFTSDAAHPHMLAVYGQPHTARDLAKAVQACRANGITVMLDMLLGGPGETPETVAHTIQTFQQISPDCAGAGLGIRLYPQTRIAAKIAAEETLEQNPGIRRRYDGPIDLLQPTFYISSLLGKRPARLVNELIGDDKRFFPPQEETDGDVAEPSGDHNYNQNQGLIDAIAAGARGAYWDILRQLP